MITGTAISHRASRASRTPVRQVLNVRMEESESVWRQDRMAGRVLYRDIVPYETPATLDALAGPATGALELPVTVHWGPRRVFDLNDPALRRAAYRAIVREGTPEVQELLLNAGVLRDLWSDLILPERCRAVWEERFPELINR